MIDHTINLDFQINVSAPMSFHFYFVLFSKMCFFLNTLYLFRKKNMAEKIIE
jgi:hypothetical protein